MGLHIKRIIILVALLATIVPATAKDSKQEIAALYTKMDHLFQNRDVEGIRSLMRKKQSSGYYTLLGKRKYNAEQSLANTVLFLKLATSVKRTPTKIYSITLNGNRATARVFGSFTATISGRDHKSHLVAVSEKGTDHWVKKNGRWQVAFEEIYGVTRTIDGKVIAPPRSLASFPSPRFRVLRVSA
jgi:hypothetical protein